MALEVDGGLVLSAILAVVIVSLLTYIFSHHPKHFTNMPPEVVDGEAQDTHVVNQDELDPNLVENLKTTMLSINKMVDYAEEKETTDPSVKPLLHKLKEVAYDAEDVLDVIDTQAHKNEVCTTTPWNPFDRSLHQQLEDVQYRMEGLLKQTKVFGLKPSTRSSSTSSTFRPPTTSLVEKSRVYGRDDDKDEIKKLLLSNDDGSNGDVIAIVGMGGLGKTTLAQLIFDDYEINGVFKSYKVWICVAEDFDVIKITKTILEKLTSQSYTTNDFDELQRKLRETLLGKRFLIALDDVWNENYSNWDNLRKPFAYAAPGSKIIVTTRSERVAAAMHATSSYKLKPLLDEDCWLLFSKHAFVNIHSNADSTYKALGRELVKKCGGLPLAAKVLGSLVGTKQGYEEWQEVLKSEIWDLLDEGSYNNILSVLRLSYHYLPSNLKRCFAFCSIVPKDFDFGREKLVFLWMAGNLLQDSNSKRRIDIGYEYLRELESRSLIQPSRNLLNLVNHELYFSMHDLVNDLAKSVAGEFYKSFDIENSFNCWEKTRHFSYEITREVYDMTKFKGISEAKRLRTFLPLLFRTYGSNDVMLTLQLRSEIWPQLNLLRSLSLPQAGIEKLSDSIGDLKLLRYLDLSWNGKIIELPESVASLYNLEVLNLSECKHLTKLPSKMIELTKLNYLNIRGTNLQEMPLQMGKLKDLDVLTNFVVGKGSGSSIGDLKELKYLRGWLRIHGLENITHPKDALEANLNGKSYLEELDLDLGDKSEDARIILENLRPHVNLKKLSMTGYSGTRLPDWLGDYSFVNLVDITVLKFKHCFDLSPLSQLPSLKSLSILYCDSLVTLIPVELPNEIHHHVGHYFSALVKLFIFDCPKLKLPQQNHCFTSIEDFSLEGGSCASLLFFPVSLLPKLRKFFLSDLESIESLAVTDEANNFNLEYLEDIWIRRCPKLKFFPVSLFQKLKKLRLFGLESIESLAVIDEANNFNLQHLESIEISSCPKLKFFLVSSFPKLKTLKLEGLQSIESLAVIDERNNFNLQYLETIKIWNCPKLKFFPLSLFPKLKTLTLEDLESIESLVVINEANNFNLQYLESIYIRKCPKLKFFLVSLFPKLKTLKLQGLQSIESLAIIDEANNFNLQYLETIEIGNCPKLKFFPLSLFPKVEHFQIDGCKKLTATRSNWGLQKMLSLSTLSIGDFECDDLESFPEEGLLPSSLSTLHIRNVPNLTNLNGKSFHPLTCLETLSLFNCPNLECLPEQGLPTSLSLKSLHLIRCPNLKALPQRGLPSSLSTLTIDGCKKLIANRSDWGLQKMLSLSTLRIGTFECDDLKSFPEEGLLPSSLSTLEIDHVPNLTNLNGKSIQLLTSLKKLQLLNCCKLQCLPEEGLPTSLSALRIWRCPLLVSRCQREQGEDWSKIAHIPNIDIK